VRRLLLLVILACLLQSGLVVAAAAEPSPLDPVCAEPGGQTDTPPGPRLRRFTLGGVDVAVVLPVGYQRHQKRRYPVVYLLHGAQGDEDSWIEYGGLMADTAARPRRQRAIVVMPRMGVITGLAVDWVDGHRRDATLVGKRLVRRIDRTYRTKSDRRYRAVAGYSGGGLSAAHLAERFPRTFGQLGVFSGAVDLRNPANEWPAYLGFEAEKLCAGDDPSAAGPLGSPSSHPDAWAGVDPLHGARSLRRTTVFLSSGNGSPCSPEEVASATSPAAATEAQLRQQVDAFSAALRAAGVRHTNQHRPCGLHWWSTWRPALGDFWDLAARRWRR
jgi:diacylglycerol O-acyltransferase/trehalose O-mycolyltransferase